MRIKLWMLLTSLIVSNFIYSFDISSILEKDKIVQGYESTDELAEMNYHSSIPRITKSLIVRGNSKEPITWNTGKIPKNIKEEFVSFVWLTGIGCNLGETNFHLSIGNNDLFKFSSTRKKQWQKKHKSGAQLLFNTDMVDGSNDNFGFMILRLPKFMLRNKKFLNIRVRGESSGKAAWFMCYKSKISSNTEIKTYPIVFKKDNKKFQVLKAQVVHFGKQSEAKFEFLGNSISKDIHFGFNEIDLPIKAVEKDTNIVIDYFVNSKKMNSYPTLVSKVKPWEIFLVQHAHTDIGYTRAQTEILPEHVRYIDYALDYCDATDNYPDFAKFKWTCETSWAVSEYIKTRPKAQIERLIKRINEGRIEVAGMLFNFNEVIDENLLTSSLQPLKDIKAEGIKIESAMQNDVNGIAWSLIDYFNSIGIKYLNMGTHNHRALLVFDKPTLFWWQAPSGKKLLTMRADHYMTGTNWGITGNNISKLETQMAAHLQDLEEKQYPFNEIIIQYSGYHTDNSPPSTFACDNIKDWNAKYETPKLRNATVGEYMKYMESKYTDSIKTYQAAWPDWWTDGAASAPQELAAVRKTQSDIVANKAALSMSRVLGAKVEDKVFSTIEELNENLLFYDEHTYGAAESIREPFCENSIIQRREKEAYAWTSVKKSRMVKEYALGQLQAFIPRTDKSTITIFNPLSFRRSTYHTLYIDNEILPVDKQFKISDSEGKRVEATLVNSRSDGNYWMLFLKDLPAFGYKTYQIEIIDRKKRHSNREKESNILENKFYKITIDKKLGTISSIFDKELNREIVDNKSEWKFAQFINEKLGSRSQMEAYSLTDFERVTAENIKISKVKYKPSFRSIEISANSPTLINPNGLKIEIRLYKSSKLIELKYKITKKSILDPEGIYVSLPFKMEDYQLSYQAQGGMVTPGQNQLPGSSSEWHTVQDYVKLSNDQFKVLVSCEEIPLMLFGEMIPQQFGRIAKVEKPHMYSFVYNNYWVTNFNSDFVGELNWSYKITSSKTLDNNDDKFGLNNRIPVLSRVLPKSAQSSELNNISLIKGIPENIAIVTCQPVKGENAILLHLKENKGIEKEFKIELSTNNIESMVNSNVLGEEIDENLKIEAYENKFIKIKLKKEDN